MAVEVVQTANANTPISWTSQYGLVLAPYDKVRVSMEGYSENLHAAITDPVTCQIGTWVSGGDPNGPIKSDYYTEPPEAGPGATTNVYTIIMNDPDSPELVGSPIQFTVPFELAADDTLDLITRLEVLDPNSLWTSTDPNAGVPGVIKTLGAFFSAAGTIVSFIPVLGQAGTYLKYVTTALTVAGDLAPPEQSTLEKYCTVTDSLIPGFGPNDPPQNKDNAAPVFRPKISGRDLWNQTSTGDAVLAYDIDWGNETITPGLCQRPHTILYYHFSRVIPEGAGTPIPQSANIVAAEPDLVDAFSFNAQGVANHEQYQDSNRAWQPVQTIPYDNSTLTSPVGQIAAISRIGGGIELFAVSKNGYLMYNSNSVAGNPWGDWTVPGLSPPPGVPGPFPPGAPIAAISRFPSHLDLFVVGNDGAIWTLWYDNGVGWGTPYAISPQGITVPFDGTSGGGIAALANPGSNSSAQNQDQYINVYVVNTNGDLVVVQWTTLFHWTGPYVLTPAPRFFWNGAAPGGSLAALQLAGDRADVFFIDVGGYVEDAVLTGPGNQIELEDVTDTPADPHASLAAVGRKVNLTGCPITDNDHMDVFTVATDGHILHNSWAYVANSRSWVENQDEELKAIASPLGQIGAVSPWPGAIYVAATQSDGTIVTTWFEDVEQAPGGGQWQEGP